VWIRLVSVEFLKCPTKLIKRYVLWNGFVPNGWTITALWVCQLLWDIFLQRYIIRIIFFKYSLRLEEFCLLFMTSFVYKLIVCNTVCLHLICLQIDCTHVLLPTDWLTTNTFVHKYYFIYKIKVKLRKKIICVFKAENLYFKTENLCFKPKNDTCNNTCRQNSFWNFVFVCKSVGM